MEKSISFLRKENPKTTLLFSDWNFKVMIDQSPSPTSIYSDDGKMVYCNEAYINLWEIEKKELRDYKKNYNLLYDSNFIEYRSDIRKVVEKGKPLKRSPKKMIVATKPDKEIYVAATFYPVIQKGDTTNEIMLIQENVGPLLYTNAELRKKIKEVTVLNDALDASSIIIEFDRDGVMLCSKKYN